LFGGDATSAPVVNIEKAPPVGAMKNVKEFPEEPTL